MPAFKGTLTQTQTRDVATYVVKNITHGKRPKKKTRRRDSRRQVLVLTACEEPQPLATEVRAGFTSPRNGGLS